MEDKKTLNSESDTLFENTFVISDFDDYAYVQQIYFSALGKKRLIKVGIIFSAMMLAFALLMLANRNYDGFVISLMVVIFFIIIFPLECSLLKKRSLKKVFKKEKSLILAEKRSKFYEDKILNLTDTSQAEIQYQQITDVIFAKKMYALLIGRVLICVDKNGFTKGSCEAFEEFIKNKISNSRIIVLKK